MKNILVPAGFAFIAFILLSAFIPGIKTGNKNTAAASAQRGTHLAVAPHHDDEKSYKTTSTLLYDSLQLDDIGLSYSALEYAVKGYQQLEEKAALRRPGILTICDFSQSSFKKRMYIIDVAHYKMLFNTYVAHGKNSGLQYADRFSNKPESLQSSLGFYITKGSYKGKHGISLKLDGQEKGVNDKAGERAIVLHGASYIGDNRLCTPYMGRSFGCPAVPQAEAATVIDFIKNGTCLFIYHPSDKYLNGSKILNG